MSKFVTDEQLEQWFAYHPPISERIREAHDQIREGCYLLAQLFSELLPEGPDKTVALRAVREAMYHANACIAVEQNLFQRPEDENGNS